MTDLISRETLVAILTKQRDDCYRLSETANGKNDLDTDDWEELGNNAQDMLNLVNDQPAIVPQVVCNISGGLLQGASATHKVDVYTLDFDICNEELSEKIIVPGDNEEARLGQEAAQVEPEWVNAVIHTPTMDEMVKCGNCEREGSVDELEPIEDLHQRVEPGETMPAGECPECGCLAHLVYPDNDD